MSKLSIAEFDAALRKLAIHCEIGEMLEEIIKDRSVCGLYVMKPLNDACFQRLLLPTNKH